jgi:hypothetical protein
MTKAESRIQGGGRTSGAPRSAPMKATAQTPFPKPYTRACEPEPSLQDTAKTSRCRETNSFLERWRVGHSKQGHAAQVRDDTGTPRDGLAGHLAICARPHERSPICYRCTRTTHEHAQRAKHSAQPRAPSAGRVQRYEHKGTAGHARRAQGRPQGSHNVQRLRLSCSRLPLSPAGQGHWHGYRPLSFWCVSRSSYASLNGR